MEQPHSAVALKSTGHLKRGTRGLTFKVRYLKEGKRMMGEGEQAGKSICSHTNMLPDSQNIKPVWAIQTSRSGILNDKGSSISVSFS